MNIYCFSTLSFAKLQFKSVINKAFHKHGVASFTDAWIETCNKKPFLKLSGCRIFYRCVDWNRKGQTDYSTHTVASFTDAWIETILKVKHRKKQIVASFTDAWIETLHLLKRLWKRKVASFTDAWIETLREWKNPGRHLVASFTDAWIETKEYAKEL